jgi:hypothetical protein
VKLRLGRISGGKQKGVDSLIVRDFMTLARERAMVTAYLLAGDEDLREGVVAAQDMGVRVIVVGIPGLRNNQAETLIREADEHVMLEKEFLSPHLSRVVIPAAPKTLIQLPDSLVVNREPTTIARVDSPQKLGSEFATTWAGRATVEEREELLRQCPRIPVPLDFQLISEAEKTLGSLREKKDIKSSIRRGFWETIKATKSH